MDENVKKPIMIVVVILCLAVAGIVTYKRVSSKGLDKVDPTKKTWMLCNNPDCGHAVEMNLKEYFQWSEDQYYSTGSVPGYVCPECGEESCFRAVKCNGCGEIFYFKSVPGTYKDKCPKCGYSQIEQDRKAAAEK